MIAQYHGAMTRVRPSDMAFPLRELGYEVEVSSYWSAPGEKTSVVQWVNALRDKMKHLDFLILLLESKRSREATSQSAHALRRGCAGSLVCAFLQTEGPERRQSVCNTSARKLCIIS